ncbi:MAG TPA: hypothetical protein VHV83_04995 [Armatimonadota bacterium]|nr:hypothetical protein [Armatimonadota bacterium]
MASANSITSWTDKIETWVTTPADDPAVIDHQFRLAIEQWLQQQISSPPLQEEIVATDENASVVTPVDDNTTEFPTEITQLAEKLGYSLTTLNHVMGPIHQLAQQGGNTLTLGALAWHSPETSTQFTDMALQFSFAHSQALWRKPLWNEFIDLRQQITGDDAPSTTLIEGADAYKAAIQTPDGVERDEYLNTALRKITEHLDSEPNDFIALYTLGTILFYEFGVVSDAEYAFHHAAELLEPYSSSLASLAYLQSAYILRCRQDWAHAYASSAEALRLSPEWAETHFQHAISAVNLGKTSDFRDELIQAINLDRQYWFRSLMEISLLLQFRGLQSILSTRYTEEDVDVRQINIQASASLEQFQKLIVKANTLDLPSEDAHAYLQQGYDHLAKATSAQIQRNYSGLLEAKRLLRSILPLCEQGPSILYNEGLTAVHQHQKELEKQLRTLARRHQLLQRKLEDRYDEQVLPLRRLAHTLSQSINTSPLAKSQHGTSQQFKWLPVAFGIGGGCMIIAQGVQGYYTSLEMVMYFGILMLIVGTIYHVLGSVGTDKTPPSQQQHDVRGMREQLSAALEQETELTGQYREERQHLREEFDRKRSEILHRLEVEVEKKRMALTELLKPEPEASSPDPVTQIRRRILLSYNTRNQGSTAVAFLSGSQLLASIGNNGRIELRDVATAMTQCTLHGNTLPLVSLATSTLGSTVAAIDMSNTIHFWKTNIALDYHTLPEPACSLALFPTGEQLVSGGTQGLITLFRLHDSSVVRQIEAHSVPIRALAISPDQQFIASAGTDNSLYLWRVADGVRHQTYTTTQSMHSLLISSDGSMLIAAGEDMTVYIYRLATADPIHTLQHSTHIRSLALSQDSSLLMAGGADGTINIWSTADWSLVDKVTDHHGAVASLAISPDQPILASAGDDSVINLWSFEIE